MPIASVMAKSVSVLMEKPQSQSPAVQPMSDTGTEIIGISVARQDCRNRNTTASTRRIASPIVVITSFRDAFTKTVVSSVTV